MEEEIHVKRSRNRNQKSSFKTNFTESEQGIGRIEQEVGAIEQGIRQSKQDTCQSQQDTSQNRISIGTSETESVQQKIIRSGK